MLFSLLLYFMIRMLAALLVNFLIPASLAAVGVAAILRNQKSSVRAWAALIFAMSVGVMWGILIGQIEPGLPALIRVSLLDGSWNFVCAIGASAGGALVGMTTLLDRSRRSNV